MLVHRRVTPSIKFAGTHLYTRVYTDEGELICKVRFSCIELNLGQLSVSRPEELVLGAAEILYENDHHC